MSFKIKKDVGGIKGIAYHIVTNDKNYEVRKSEKFIHSKLKKEFGCNIQQFENLINKLLPLISFRKGFPSGIESKGFAHPNLINQFVCIESK